MPNDYGDPISIDRACDRYDYAQWELGVRYFTVSGTGCITDCREYSDQVRNGSVDFICIETHTSSGTNKPGLGVNWTTYWEISYRHYTRDESRYPISPTSPGGSTYTADGRKLRGYSWKLCPFSLEWRTRYLDSEGNGINGYYRTTVSGAYQFMEVPIGEQTVHTTTNGHMRGLVKSYICDDPNCWYYTDSGTKFIEV
jgi:hypothetical protein